jgi:hypothetical protein
MTKKKKRPQSKKVHHKSRKHILTELRPNMVRHLALRAGPLGMIVDFLINEIGLVGTKLGSSEASPSSSADLVTWITELFLL